MNLFRIFDFSLCQIQRPRKRVKKRVTKRMSTFNLGLIFGSENSPTYSQVESPVESFNVSTEIPVSTRSTFSTPCLSRGNTLRLIEIQFLLRKPINENLVICLIHVSTKIFLFHHRLQQRVQHLRHQGHQHHQKILLYLEISMQRNSSSAGIPALDFRDSWGPYKCSIIFMYSQFISFWFHLNFIILLIIFQASTDSSATIFAVLWNERRPSWPNNTKESETISIQYSLAR